VGEVLLGEGDHFGEGLEGAAVGLPELVPGLTEAAVG
jgi:hypothetical protein